MGAFGRLCQCASRGDLGEGDGGDGDGQLHRLALYILCLDSLSLEPPRGMMDLAKPSRRLP